MITPVRGYRCTELGQIAALHLCAFEGDVPPHHPEAIKVMMVIVITEVFEDAVGTMWFTRPECRSPVFFVSSFVPSIVLTPWSRLGG